MPGTVLADVSSWCRHYLAASHVGDRCGHASLPSAPSYSLQSSDEGTELLVRHCLVPSCDSGWWSLSGGCEAPRLGYSIECWSFGYPCYRILHGVNHFYQGTLILCLGHHDVYTCSLGWATMSGGDGRDSSTWVRAVRCMWAPAATSYLARQ
jgi:hypothetical protein